jgi:uncharacterized membrane protein YcfT
MAKARHKWMDMLRGLAILMVIILHATLVIGQFGQAPWPPLLIFTDLLAPLRMPLLIFLSGLLLGPSLQKGWLRYLEGKVRRVAYPYLLWSLLFFHTLYDGPDDHTLWAGTSYLWFILFLFVYYCIALMTVRIHPLAIAIAVLVLSALMPDGSKHYERFFYLIGLFFLGHYAGRSPDVLEHFTSRKWAIPAVVIALAFALAVATLPADSMDMKYKSELILPTLAGIAAAIFVAKKIAGSPWTRPLEYMGEHSLKFYVVHHPMIYLTMYLCLSGGIGPVPLISFMSLAAAVSAGYLATALYRKNAFAALAFELPSFMDAGLTRNQRAEREEERIAPFTRSNRRSI